MTVMELVCVRDVLRFRCPIVVAIFHRIRRFAKVNVNKVKQNVRYHIMSSCKLFLLMYTFIILTMRLSAWHDWVTKDELKKGQD